MKENDLVLCCDLCGVEKIEKDLVEVKVKGEPILLCIFCWIKYKGLKKHES